MLFGVTGPEKQAIAAGTERDVLPERNRTG